MDQALDGIRVLDLTHHVAGPYATKLLAGYGAEVIKIERPDGGDPTRRWGPFPNDVPHPEKSGFFLHLNTGKKSVTLNLETETGLRILKRLVEDADVLVENFSPRVMPSLGLSWEVVHAINPKLVMVSISNFGDEGPYRDYEANELTVYAMGGMMYTTGEPDREPVKNFGHQAEYMAGMNGFLAAMAAVYAREFDGVGQRVALSIQEIMASALEMAGPTANNYSLDSARRGTSQQRAAVGTYPCKDGHVMIYFALGRRIETLFQAMGRPELMNDPRFSTPAARQENNDLLHALIYSWCAEHTKKEIYELAGKVRAPMGSVVTVDELIEWPALREAGFWQEADHPYAGKLTYPGGPFVLPESPYVLQRAPLLGEHNEEILCGRLGYTEQQLAQLRELGII